MLDYREANPFELGCHEPYVDKDFHVPSHRLTLEKGSPTGEWRLDWDDSAFTLTAPDGTRVLEEMTTFVHRFIRLDELYAEGKISFETTAGSLTFRSDPNAVADIKLMIDAGLRSDNEYRDFVKAAARGNIRRGMGMFVFGATLFGLFCWWASVNEDMPAGHWLFRISPLVSFALVVLLAIALAGPVVAYSGFRQSRRIKNIERELVRRNRPD